MHRLAVFLLAVLLLAGCERTPVVVGSKDTVQDRILGEMMARLIEAHDLPVERRMALGGSADVFQALRAGNIDIYPEYTGTALALLGAPPETDRAAARERLAGPFAALGLEFLQPFGFDSSYVVVTRRALARVEGIDDIGDLAGRANRLRLGVSEGYAERPLDGLSPFLERFGLDFRDVVMVPNSRREELYSMLIEEQIDLMIGFSTDPQIADFGLVTVKADRPFFPAYEAAPLTTTDALQRHPGLATALAPLAERLPAA
ncbi:MAG TPA: glycine betaine ABC transporter substrate-binding protein, partial [Alphaproteobacteria bacterium]|nr:glycine betaine ABC transporter substrate-binding protein [Alphaproteobacteria bacterium]